MAIIDSLTPQQRVCVVELLRLAEVPLHVSLFQNELFSHLIYDGSKYYKYFETRYSVNHCALQSQSVV